jgi:hypothetical protein
MGARFSRLVVTASMVSIGLVGTSGPAMAAEAPTSSPVVAIENSGSVQTVPDTTELTGVACVNASSCEAVGFNAFWGVSVHTRSGIPGKAVQVTTINAWAFGIACVGTSVCEAVGWDENPPTTPEGAVAELNIPYPGSDFGTVVAGTATLLGVACKAITCEAVGQNSAGVGVVVPNAFGNPTPPVVVPGTNYLTGVACPSVTTCIAVGQNSSHHGVVLPVTYGVPGTAIAVPKTVTLVGIACHGPSMCEAVGKDSNGSGVAVSITSGSPGAPVVVPSTTSLNGIACHSATACDAVGESTSHRGLAVPVTSGTPGTSRTWSSVGDLSGVTCPSATFCEAVGTANSPTGVVVTW